jgi:hypothetical protein
MCMNHEIEIIHLEVLALPYIKSNWTLQQNTDWSQNLQRNMSRSFSSSFTNQNHDII